MRRSERVALIELYAQSIDCGSLGSLNIMPPRTEKPPVIVKKDGFYLLTAAGGRTKVPCAAVFAKLNAARSDGRGQRELAEMAVEYTTELRQLEDELDSAASEGGIARRLMMLIGPVIESAVAAAAAKSSGAAQRARASVSARISVQSGRASAAVSSGGRVAFRKLSRKSSRETAAAPYERESSYVPPSLPRRRSSARLAGAEAETTGLTAYMGAASVSFDEQPAAEAASSSFYSKDPVRRAQALMARATAKKQLKEEVEEEGAEEEDHVPELSEQFAQERASRRVRESRRDRMVSVHKKNSGERLSAAL